jgi:hypothetical protein
MDLSKIEIDQDGWNFFFKIQKIVPPENGNDLSNRLTAIHRPYGPKYVLNETYGKEEKEK